MGRVSQNTNPAVGVLLWDVPWQDRLAPSIPGCVGEPFTRGIIVAVQQEALGPKP